MKITHSWRHHELWFSAIYGKDSIYMYSVAHSGVRVVAGSTPAVGREIQNSWLKT